MRLRTGLLLTGLAAAAALATAAAVAFYPSAPTAVAPVPAVVLARIQPGDLIFRRGTALVSTTVRVLEDGTYSHVGMLVGGPGHWRVVNAVPAEAAGRKNAVVVDKLRFFEAPTRASAVAVYHVAATPAQRARAVAWTLRQVGRPFGFGTGDTYCTKLVWNAWRQAGLALHVHFTTLHVPLLGNRYLLPSGLLRSPRLHLVWSSAVSLR